jgi:CelD/BcsL family acetyltransferase involved in cellulose biosynthesis
MTQVDRVADVDVASKARPRTSSSKLTFRVFQGLEGLRSIAELWDRVLASIEQPEFFYRYVWYETALTTWPADAALTYFVVAYRDETPVAICPLQLSESRAFGLPIRVLSTLDPHAISYSDFVCAPNAHADLLTALIEELRSSKQIGWDLLTLPKCYHTAAVAPTADRLASVPGVLRHLREVCYYFPTEAGMDVNYARMSRGGRQHLKKCRKQLGQIGEVEFLWTRDPALLPDFFEQFLALEASGWKGAEGTAIKCNPTLVRFYAGLMTAFGESGDCEINLMRVGGQNVAGDFALLSAGTWNQLKMAYDEEFRKNSPGYVLLDGMFSRLCEDEGVRSANILTGADWAARLRGLELEVWRVVARNRTLRGKIAFQEIRLRRFMHDRAVPLVKRVTSKLKRSAPQE